jgi:hypothetical protein
LEVVGEYFEEAISLDNEDVVFGKPFFSVSCPYTIGQANDFSAFIIFKENIVDNKQKLSPIFPFDCPFNSFVRLFGCPVLITPSRTIYLRMS